MSTLKRVFSIITFFLIITGGVLFGEATPPRIAVLSVPQLEDLPPRAAPAAIQPVQGHIGPEIYPIPIPEHENLKTYLNLYSKPQHIGWIRDAYERGFIYRDFIVDRLYEAGAPYELIFLPIVESEYINSTISRSGAAGIWQFMMNSIYPDMYVNQWMDDRKNFWKATDAAIHKLLFNYGKLQDWPLALAAYNCGLGRVTRIIEETGITSFWELSDKMLLPPETINYVPRYFAMIRILSYPGRYGITLPWREELHWEAVPLKQTVDLRILAEHSGVPYNILVAGNDELHYAITPPDNMPFNLKIPSKYTDQIKRTLEDKNFQLLRFYIYTIKRGDTLYALARHYGVSVQMISRYNQGINPMALQIGHNMIIPALFEVQPYVAPPPAPVKEDIDIRPYTETYVVKDGDTLWSIAREFDTTVSLLSTRNSLSEASFIRPGQELKVPGEKK